MKDDNKYRIIDDDEPMPAAPPKRKSRSGHNVRVGLIGTDRIRIDFDEDRYEMDLDGARQIAEGILDFVEMAEKEMARKKKKKMSEQKEQE